MKSRFKVFVLLFVLIEGFTLAACGGAAPAATSAPAFDYGFAADAEAPAATEAPAMEAPAMAVPEVVSRNDAPAPSSDGSAAPVAASHMIIKNADIKLLVNDTDIAIDRATQAVGDLGGYIISSRVWYQLWGDGKNYRYATITIGVPVTEFEHLLSRFRGLAVQVIDETATGDDVSNQFVDLQSQLTNLEATRDRIKGFLDQAKTVDEALRINQEMANVEAQIESIKGQMNYLQDRSAYSTITLNLEPVLPEVIATSTPTPTPVPTVGWDPGKTYTDAKKSVTSAYQNVIDFLIWVFVVFVPIFAPIFLVIWIAMRWINKKPNKPTS